MTRDMRLNVKWPSEIGFVWLFKWPKPKSFRGIRLLDPRQASRTGPWTPPTCQGNTRACRPHNFQSLAHTIICVLRLRFLRYDGLGLPCLMQLLKSFRKWRQHIVKKWLTIFCHKLKISYSSDDTMLFKSHQHPGPACGRNTYQIMYGETLDFQCQHQQ